MTTVTFDNKTKRLNAVLVSIPLPDVTDEEASQSLAELERLVTTLGFDIHSTVSQRRPSLSGSTILGDGKLKEIAKLTGGTGIVPSGATLKKSKAAERFDQENAEEDSEIEVEQVPDANLNLATAVIFDCEVSPSQLANLKSATGVEVFDRTGVIVEIFSRHAKTKEAKLQVEIARLKYLAPRARETGGDSGDRMGGTSGETALELDRRKIRDRISFLKKELDLLQTDQSTKRTLRSEQFCVALVGYTNAGKSSLMRALTGSEVLVADKLFATLDTTVRTMFPVTVPKILVSDTVGFIKKLPHDLVASFRSTLDEAKNASLLLYVVDASDSTFRSQLQVTRDVLSEIGVDKVPSRLILNKIDRLKPTEVAELLQEFPEAFALCAKNPDDIRALQDKILTYFESNMIEKEILIPYSVQGVLGDIRNNMRVLGERYDEAGVYLTLKSNPESLLKLEKDLAKKS